MASLRLSLLGGLGAVACTALELRRRERGLAFSAAEKPKCIVVKMGGSAITVKSKLETLNETALDATAVHISDARAAGVKLAVLHGAGSFGHFQAKQYGISKGDSHPDWLFGFADTRRAVTLLNQHVVGRLVSARVPAVGLPAFPTARMSAKNLTHQGTLLCVDEILNRGLVPVVHGDAIFDAVQGSAIISGDVILEELCKDVRPDLAVFLTDVPGVFTLPPNEPGAMLIPEIPVNPDGSCVLPKMSTAAHDVTGGIEEKLKTAVSVALKGIPVIIVQVGTEHAAKALRGEKPDVATTIRLRS